MEVGRRAFRSRRLDLAATAGCRQADPEEEGDEADGQGE
jgi:hypothetical protein